MDAVAKNVLHRALFEISLEGIRSTGTTFPLGGFILVGAMIDMLAGLRYAPGNDADGQQGRRYARFVHEYFPAAYRQMNLGPTLWRHLRCTTLHNFSSVALSLADNQPGTHLTTLGGRTALNWAETLADYETALHAYWQAMNVDPAIEANVERRCAQYPPLTIRFYGGLTFPLTFPATFSGASGYTSGL